MEGPDRRRYSGILTRAARRPAPTDNRNLFRVKGRIRMRILRAAVFFVVISVVSQVFAAELFAAELNVKVIDPQSAAVIGAQVSLVKASNSALITTQYTSTEGIATLAVPGGGEPYQVRVLAPGFAIETADVSAHADAVTVQLKLAPASETVVVTATRNPVPEGAAGADVAALNN